MILEIMFKEGSRVEVLRGKGEGYGSWFLARIQSRVGDVYVVRYELCLTRKGEPLEERVCEEDVRPCPPPAPEGECWVLGDITEAFDLRSWKAGEIVKVLPNNYFVVRLFCSGEIKKFPVSVLRVRQAWQNNSWVVLGKVFEQKDIYTTSKHENYVDSRTSGPTQRCPEGYENKRLNFHGISFPDNILVKVNHKKKRWTSDLGETQPLAKRAAVQPRKDISGNFLDETTSSSAPKVGKDHPDVAQVVVSTNVHELELQAYKSTIEALHASGPLTWEQESLLTSLRMCLHISNEEHLFQVRNLLST